MAYSTRFSTADAEYLMRHKELQLVSSSMRQVEAAMQRVDLAAGEYARALQGAVDVFAVFAGVNRVERPTDYIVVQRLGAELKALQKSKPLAALKSGLRKNGKKFTSSVRQPIQSAQELATKCEPPLKQYVKSREKVHKARLKAMPHAELDRKKSVTKSSLLGCLTTSATSTKASSCGSGSSGAECGSTNGLSDSDIRAAEEQLLGQRWYADLVKQLDASHKVLEKGNRLFLHEMLEVSHACSTSAKRSVDVMLKLNIEYMEHVTAVLRGAWVQFSLGRADQERRQREEAVRVDNLIAHRKLHGPSATPFVEGTVIETEWVVPRDHRVVARAGPNGVGGAVPPGPRPHRTLSGGRMGSAPPRSAGAAIAVLRQGETNNLDKSNPNMRSGRHNSGFPFAEAGDEHAPFASSHRGNRSSD